MTQPKILVIDIETMPAKVVAWQLFDQNISPAQVLEPAKLLCYAAKWVGSKYIRFDSAWADKELMVSHAWELLNAADIVVHYNGASFDIPHLNREFVLHDLGPPAPFKQVDLYRTVKHQFKFLSNKLGYVGPELGIGSKVEHEGLALWLAVMDGNEAAQRRMKKYNVGDVRLTEALYEKLLPWIPNHPNLAAMADAPDTCPRCLGVGGFRFAKWDYRPVTKKAVFRHSCGAYVHARKIEPTKATYS